MKKKIESYQMNSICFEILVQDDGFWKQYSMYGSSNWIPEIISLFNEANKWIKNNKLPS